MESKFKKGDLVLHVKTGGLYKILFEPSLFSLEHTHQPGYSYSNLDGTLVTARDQLEMEDGRFLFVRKEEPAVKEASKTKPVVLTGAFEALVQYVFGSIFFVIWVAGFVMAKGFWSTLFCLTIVWSYYLVIEFFMKQYLLGS